MIKIKIVSTAVAMALAAAAPPGAAGEIAGRISDRNGGGLPGGAVRVAAGARRKAREY